MDGPPADVVDAFSEGSLRGNPAGVRLLERPRPARLMQRVAEELRHSETAFHSPVPGGHRLRWFTPSTEVDLCGHATLASAHVLWSEGQLSPGSVARFSTRSGQLTARRTHEGIELDLPADPPRPVPTPPRLRRALGAMPRRTGRTRRDYVVELRRESELRRVAPDLSALATLPVRGVVVTCRSRRPGADVFLRFFAPRVGVPEDPVTGSALAALGPYWADRLGREPFVAEQLSERGGRAVVRPRGPRVRIAGRAVTAWRGEWLARPERAPPPGLVKPG